MNGRDYDRHGNGEAKICDPRNDEHRIVSQLTVAWMTLHNEFVTDLGYDFDDAREATIKEWQAVVLTDLLPALLDEAVRKIIIAVEWRGYAKQRRRVAIMIFFFVYRMSILFI